jgi:hypothetical protein
MPLPFALAVSAIVFAVDVVVVFAFGVGSTRHADGGIAWVRLLAINPFVAPTIALGSPYRIVRCRRR